MERSTKISNLEKLKDKRQDLRNNPTSPESLLWQRLKGKQLSGFKFRRQHSIGNFIVDFYCSERKLAVEIDGDSHFSDSGKSYDIIRTEYLNKMGISVIRFTNIDVTKHITGVLEKILIVLHQTPPPTPPQRGGGK